MHAPVVDEARTSRQVLLPGRKRWFSAMDGKWLRGGQRLSVAVADDATPLYFREGAIVPMQPGERVDHANELDRVDFHVFLAKDSKGRFRTAYTFDDGETFAYLQKKQTTLEMSAESTRRSLRIQAATTERGSGPCRFRIVLHAEFPNVVLTINGKDAKLAWTEQR